MQTGNWPVSEWPLAVYTAQHNFEARAMQKLGPFTLGQDESKHDYSDLAAAHIEGATAVFNSLEYFWDPVDALNAVPKGTGGGRGGGGGGGSTAARSQVHCLAVTR